MYDGVLTRNGIMVTRDRSSWVDLSCKYGVPTEEIGLIDFNRTGICLEGKEVKVGFRARFNAELFYHDDFSWFALPVRTPKDSEFHARGKTLSFLGEQVGTLDRPVLDTCNMSYQRGEHLLNLNSRSRSNCAGCKACVHNDKSLYDDTVIKDHQELRTKSDLYRFFALEEQRGLNVCDLEQIAVVTGLFADEQDALQHLKDVADVAKNFGFHGEILYFGCQIMSPSVIEQFAMLGNTSIVFAIDNFTERKTKLSRAKSSIELADFYKSMMVAKKSGIQTTFAYVVGLDNLSDLSEGFSYFEEVCTRFPVANIFQIQTDLQAKVINDEAKNLEYYVRARKCIEEIFDANAMRPRRWENYRPLWYRKFGDELLTVKPYG
ncbi:hypothetical protein IJG01_02590 [Candidatus Saccharibacteria bacterium]|nr:hypothetical protein [Candidatus Saccharibacteria bacterium]